MRETDQDLFDSLMEALELGFAESGVSSMRSSDGKQGTCILYQVDDVDYYEAQVFLIPDKEDFINRLRDRLGEETFDVHDDDTQEVVWEEIQRFKVGDFDY